MKRIDYSALQQTYARMHADGDLKNQTERAHHVGVCRVSVSSVLREIKGKVG